MKVLITGGAGYVGHQLTRSLLYNDDVECVIVYDNLSRGRYSFFLHDKFPKGRVRFVKGEILDTRKLRKLIEEVDVVYHLAAKVSSTMINEDAHMFEQINHWGTAELAYAIEESNIEKFIYLSSTSVYGEASEPIDYKSIPNPHTFYANSKLRAEKHVQRLFPKLKTIVMRSANVFGYSPSCRFDSVINKFMFEANFVGKINIQGNGNQYRPFVHIDKAVDILTNLLTDDKLDSGIYNMVGKNLSVNEIADLIRGFYPNLEMIYINQHLGMPELVVKPDERIAHLITKPHQSIEQDLQRFKDQFAFSSFE